MAAKIEVDIEKFILAHPGGWISPVIPNNKLPPQQRGPNCGFYALAYVLNYWHNCGGDEAKMPAPLPARTHQEEPQQQKQVLPSFKQALKTFRERGTLHIVARVCQVQPPYRSWLDLRC
jgi:hypothetical protein